MTQYISKLPAVFQTVTEKKFFDATFDQVFSKKDSSLLYGYLGRRTPGIYNPISDFYLPEPNKDRTWWQLEATAFAKNADSTKTNIFFYDDLLTRINYYGGNTLNQDRLFESEYYSWAPPIDVDMFTNYQNYYWIDQGLPVINITGVTSADIIGQSSYTTPLTAIPANLTLTSGMKIVLADESPAALTVENIGDCIGIRLVPQFPDFTPGTMLEFLPWDGTTELANGRVINNERWDALPWETQVKPGLEDYITIERGSLDRNAWSRTNKWYHISAINATIAALGAPFPASAIRALRPIIQFIADLTLYKSGSQFRNEINYGFGDDQFRVPYRFSNYQGVNVETVNNELSTDFVGGELICFFNDDTPFDLWDITGWDIPLDGWDSGIGVINDYIFLVTIGADNSINFVPHTSRATPVTNGDIVFVTEDGPYYSAKRGQTWYYSNNIWQEAYNDKVTTNQPPLFQLYDHNGVKLDDNVTYPSSTFSGSKVFSYKINTTPGAYTDPVLGFPIVYTSLGQASDIMFQNNLITDRYTYNTGISIDGYYYYTLTDDTILYNNWNLHQPCLCNITLQPNCVEVSKQRVVDRYVIGYGAEYKFKLSVTPVGYVFGAGPIQLSSDSIISVNGVEVKNQVGGFIYQEINKMLYVDLTTYLTNLLNTAQAPVVEIHTYTHGLLDPAAPGYFEIPQQLEANPTQKEISEISGSNLSQQFTSIIQNQANITGIAVGNNSYRDTVKNRSVGTYILQNVTPLLKSMLISSADDIDFITGVRFSQTEYTKFKNKYLSTALQLINKGFNPVQYHNKTIVISDWVEEILKTVNVSNEFSDAFAYSYMIANGSPYITESHIVPITGDIALTNYVDLSNLTNALYIYDNTGHERLLVIGRDYEIISTNLSIDIHINLANIPVGNSLYIVLYKNPVPAYIPSTPSKLGMYPTYIPRVELDTSYAIPAYVIIGHDGSKTILTGTYSPMTAEFSDYRDALLIELEVRIYNLIQYKFRHQYYVPLRLESVKDGYFRKTRYSREEYLDITESYLNKWSAANRANYRVNDWYTSYLTTPVNQLWKLYNYTSAIVNLTPPVGQPPYKLYGNWKSIFQYYFDTIYPNTRPWEMLGFSSQPAWWSGQYGVGITNSLGEQAWPNTPAYALMWADLEYGIIRQGPSAIYNPITLLPQEQPMWARPGLSAIIPVDALGEIIPIPTLFNITIVSPTEPYDHFDDPWKYGDGSPVEQAWMSTSAYAFSVQEFLYLMKPAAFGELFWDTVGTELSPGTIDIPGVDNPVMSSVNWQYVQNDVFSHSDPFFAWMRPKNADQLVHAESVDNEIQLRFGYQRWISDRILFLGKDITSTFGQLVRTLDVNLANKLAGFTNKDTTTTYIEAISPGVSSTSLLIPTNNFSVSLHTGQPLRTYSYSGVIIRAIADGTFVVYGYDLLNAEFLVLDRSNAQMIDISVGGTPAEYLPYTKGQTYNIGDIVRYNGVYYISLAVQIADGFNTKTWNKLKSLPTVGGVSVTYKPVSEKTLTRVPYGSILGSIQEVFDLLIGWGAYLESQGWIFEEVNQDTNIISNWLYSGKQFLFWLNTNWAPDASIQLSPASNLAKLQVQAGYPNDVETISNGVYSILDKFGIAIPPNFTSTDRVGQLIQVSPTDPESTGIYFIQVNSSETEHILIFDNATSFGDTIYDPLLRVRQGRLRFNGFRSNSWYGKMEAPGYLVIGDQLVPNYDTIVESMRYFYDPNITIDNPSLEDLGRHLIGYESKSYLDNLQVSNDVQYLFYKGAIRQKGTIQSFDKLFRSSKVRGNESIEVYEEWALKLGNFGNTIEQVSTEFTLIPEQNSGEVTVARLNYIPSTIGFIKQINILNAQNTYTVVPKLIISAPDASQLDINLNAPLRQATAYVVLDSAGHISRVDITDAGYGYLSAPTVYIDTAVELHNADRLYAVWQGEIIRDTSLNNIIEIDIDDTALWTTRPLDPENSLKFPTTNIIDYPLPNAGYANFDDVKWSAFDNNEIVTRWGSVLLNPIENDSIWIAKTFTEDWGVYKMVNINQPFSVIKEFSGSLTLRTPKSYLITPQLSPNGDTTDFGNLISMQVIEATGTATRTSAPISATASALVPLAATATATGINSFGGVAGINITSAGAGYDFIPTVLFSSPAGQSTASATSTISSTGTVTGIQVVNAGTGYTLAPSVSIAAPIITRAIATATVSGGAVTGLVIVDAGAGYTTPPTVTIRAANFEYATAIATVSSGVVTAISPVINGSGYAVTPTVEVDPPVYTSATATATVSGGLVTGVVLGNHGKGYGSAPTVSIAGPTLVTASANAVVNSSGGISSINWVRHGSGYATNPSVTLAAPTYTQANATPILTGGALTGITPGATGAGYAGSVASVTVNGDGIGASVQASVSGGRVSSYTILSPGSGYTSMTLTVSAPNGTQATFSSTVVNGSVSTITILSAGSGYTSGSSLSIDAPTGVPATGHSIVSSGSVSSIVLDTPGSGYSLTAPAVTIGMPNGSTATATAILVSGAITGYTIVSGGSGYSSVPDVTIGSPGGNSATVTAIIGAGKITGFIITSGGSGYTSEPDVIIARPPGSTASATATIVNGSISGFVITSAGGGYTTPPVVTIGTPSGSSTTATAIATIQAGIISSISILEPGSGYITPPTITIQSPVGDRTVQSLSIIEPGLHYITAPSVSIFGNGSGATAIATIVNGQVDTLDVTNHGSNYTSASVVIDPPPTNVVGSVESISIVKTGSGYTTAPTVTITDGTGPVFGPGIGATAKAEISGGIVTNIVITNPGSGYNDPIITMSLPLAVNPATNYVVGFAFNTSDTDYNYYNLLSLSGDALTENEVPDYLNFTKLMVFKTMRFYTEPSVGTPSYVSIGDKIWVDNINLTPTQWNVYDIVLPSTLYPTGHKLFRKQEPLINTTLFESARIYETSTHNELALLPIYDPFKNILPALAKQNISWTSLSDPTQYNVTGNPRLYNANITFGEAQVGKLWWDLSNIRYVYYEQPMALDGSETPTQNLVYRRDRWGQIFPGSTVDIYEWTKSPVPPAEYTGTGTPRSTTDYVQLVTSNRFTNITQTNYYFWVANTANQPNIENRTLAGINVAKLIESPRSQQVEFFAPIQQTAINNSYMFYNVQEALIWRGNNVQVEYRLAERDDQKHTQWKFFREGDKSSVVTTQFWDKMVDSLCGYTKMLPASNEWNGLVIANNLPWDIYGWDIAPWDDATSTNSPIYGEILPVPDPALSYAEKYGISYRPRQGMFIDLYAARKIFVQSGNNLLQHIPIRDDNSAWNVGVTSDVYWTYTTWYKVGFENVIPTVIFTTLLLAQNALVAGILSSGTIVQVVDGTLDGRYVLYNVQQPDLNVPTQSLELVAIDASAIKLLDTIYTTKNVYGLSIELRQLLNALRTEVFIDTNIVDQNELYFSMLNYVTSEQKNPDWLFKTSYIYIKENNIQLTQSSLYIPNQIDNIMKYIIDAKPYHTQIRDYTSTYLITDIATGTAIDSHKWNIKLQFGPDYAGDANKPDINTLDAMPGWDLHQGPFIGPWDNPIVGDFGHEWDNIPTMSDILNQTVSGNPVATNFDPGTGPWPDVITIPVTVYDSGKKGYSNLYPYTIDFSSINIDNPQSFITPADIVGIQIGSEKLIYGQDYYVESNTDATHTVYFFNDPSTGPVPEALVWFDGGNLLAARKSLHNDETARGTATDNLVVNVDTRLPVNDVSGILITYGDGNPVIPAPLVAPYVGWGDSWDSINDPVISQILLDANGTTATPWDMPLELIVLPNTISSKENTGVNFMPEFYRNADIYSGVLVEDLPAPSAETENLDTIVVFDPDNVIPDPDGETETVWINGERIQYRIREEFSTDTWKLRLVQRGTMGTAPTNHDIDSKVWVERHNTLAPDANTANWSASNSNPDISTVDPLNSTEFTSVTSVPAGGLWYAKTPEAMFLKQEQGISIV